MARLDLLLLLLSFALSMAASAATYSTSTDFIKASCQATRYPALCVHCLTGYASIIRQSERHLVQTSLTVSLSRARSAAAFVAKMAKVKGIKAPEYEAVQDCIENMGDTVDRLSQSVKELGHMGRAVGLDFLWHISNVQTWVSAALTDENTCVDGFRGRGMDGSMKSAIRRRIVHVAQVTSNALALVNRFASRHRSAAATQMNP